MSEYRPHLLPKMRSRVLMDAIGGKFTDRPRTQPMPCTLRIAGFAGLRCAGRDTVVGCHTGNLGRGVSTKVSDMSCVAGCMVCHDLLDRRNPAYAPMMEKHGVAVMQRILTATHETQSMLLDAGIITVAGATFV